MNKKSKGLLGMASTLLLVASLSTSVAFAEEAGSDMEKSIAAGGDEHLTKPLNADELFNTINRFLN